MSASLPVLLLRPHVFHWLGWPTPSPLELLFMVLGTALVWGPVTLATPAVDRATLKQFYARVRPPGFWRHVGVAATSTDTWGHEVRQWLIGTVGLLAATIGPLQLMVGPRPLGWLWCGVAVLAWGVVLRDVLRENRP